MRTTVQSAHSLEVYSSGSHHGSRAVCDVCRSYHGARYSAISGGGSLAGKTRDEVV